MVLRTKVNIVSWITFLLLIGELNVAQPGRISKVKREVAYSKKLIPAKTYRKINDRG
jgi:hypothetical protein